MLKLFDLRGIVYILWNIGDTNTYTMLGVLNKSYFNAFVSDKSQVTIHEFFQFIQSVVIGNLNTCNYRVFMTKQWITAGTFASTLVYGYSLYRWLNVSAGLAYLTLICVRVSNIRRFKFLIFGVPIFTFRYAREHSENWKRAKNSRYTVFLIRELQLPCVFALSAIPCQYMLAVKWQLHIGFLHFSFENCNSLACLRYPPSHVCNCLLLNCILASYIEYFDRSWEKLRVTSLASNIIIIIHRRIRTSNHALIHSSAQTQSSQRRTCI